MILKCVGGRRDGSIVDVDNKGYSRDIYLPVLETLSLSTESQQISTVDKELYELDWISFPGNEHVYYLRFYKWTPIEAMNFLIRNHNRDGEK